MHEPHPEAPGTARTTPGPSACGERSRRSWGPSVESVRAAIAAIVRADGADCQELADRVASRSVHLRVRLVKRALLRLRLESSRDRQRRRPRAVRHRAGSGRHNQEGGVRLTKRKVGIVAVLPCSGWSPWRAPRSRPGSTRRRRSIRKGASAKGTSVGVSLNLLWVVIGAVLVIFMQAGFALVETGFCRAKHAAHVFPRTSRSSDSGSWRSSSIGFPIMFSGFSYPGYFGLDAPLSADRLIGFGDWTFLWGRSGFAL